MKASKKTEKTVKFIENPTKDKKSMNKIPKRKYDTNNSKKDVISKTNAGSEVHQ